MLRQLRYKFVEQYPVGFYTCDFYVVNHNLIIEADGVYWHSLPQSKIRDKQKDTYLTRKGFKILRLPGDKIHQDKEWCIQQIRDSIKADRPFKQLSLF
jgi:5-methyltetrahydrofolate--homocysteine methyltransferase